MCRGATGLDRRRPRRADDAPRVRGHGRNPGLRRAGSRPGSPGHGPSAMELDPGARGRHGSGPRRVSSPAGALAPHRRGAASVCLGHGRTARRRRTRAEVRRRAGDTRSGKPAAASERVQPVARAWIRRNHGGNHEVTIALGPISANENDLDRAGSAGFQPAPG